MNMIMIIINKKKKTKFDLAKIVTKSNFIVFPKK